MSQVEVDEDHVRQKLGNIQVKFMSVTILRQNFCQNLTLFSNKIIVDFISGFHDPIIIKLIKVIIIINKVDKVFIIKKIFSLPIKMSK